MSRVTRTFALATTLLLGSALLVDDARAQDLDRGFAVASELLSSLIAPTPHGHSEGHSAGIARDECLRQQDDFRAFTARFTREPYCLLK